MNFEDRIFKNFKLRAKDAFKYHKCEHLIPKTDHDQEYEKILGCDRFTYVQYLKSKFKDGMAEFNYGIEGWHIDHIFPLARATPDNLIFWLHYLNTQPLWKKQNEDKCDYIFDLNEVRLVQKIICEAKQIVYTDTIDPIQVCKFSRPYLKQLKRKGQITDHEIEIIKENHKNNIKTKKKQKNTDKSLQENNQYYGLPKRKLKGKESLNKKELRFCQNNNIQVKKIKGCNQWRIIPDNHKLDKVEIINKPLVTNGKEKKELHKSKEQLLQEEKRQRRIDVYAEKDYNENKKLQDIIKEQQKIISMLRDENKKLKNKLYKTKECTLKLPIVENVNFEDIKMFEQLFSKENT
jgi:hypothetical protein